ncbi:broad substrate specificity ATP-binding cassette transporter ABCG2-like [Coregonus clupeaformis]|uniref:broad substrate specificity ATP-binding cassette transporter ABCG2-like n=1 Tax=Coregonus clupeaformis TaxID=59861 RepID=UPI001E1C34C8|nr:broad substrate specificity ATP-binding cassette transporter ABCG2-like [Coregonus clupeaformis]
MFLTIELPMMTAGDVEWAGLSGSLTGRSLRQPHGPVSQAASRAGLSGSLTIFSGLLVNLPSIVEWLAWFQYLSIPRYGLTALQINEFLGLQFCGDKPLNGTLPPGMTCTGEDFLKNQGIDYTTWGLWQNHVALAIMTMIFLAIAYLKLRFIKKFT